MPLDHSFIFTRISVRGWFTEQFGVLVDDVVNWCSAFERGRFDLAQFSKDTAVVFARDQISWKVGGQLRQVEFLLRRDIVIFAFGGVVILTTIAGNERQ